MPRKSLFWSEDTKPTAMEWEKWMDLFAVAVMAKYSISIRNLAELWLSIIPG